MDEATLFKFGKWIDYGNWSKNFPSKGEWSASCDRFWYEVTPFLSRATLTRDIVIAIMSVRLSVTFRY